MPLVLNRRIGERIAIGDNVIVTVVDIQGGKVRIGIDAPKDVVIHREEVWLRIKADQERIDRILNDKERQQSCQSNEESK